MMLGFEFIQDGTQKFIQTPRPERYDLSVDFAELKDLHDAQAPEEKELSEVLARFGATAPEASSEKLDAETNERLAALGYLQGSAGTNATGDDPKDKLDILRLFFRSERTARADTAHHAPM